MANDFDDDFTLPDVATMRPGLPILAAEVAKVLNCLNTASAWVGSGHAFQQSWQGVDVDVAEGVERLAVARWWVHAPSDAHVSVRIRVRCEGRGRVTFSSDLGEDSIELAFGDPDAEDGSAWLDVGDLTIGHAIGDALWYYSRGDAITMDVAGGLSEGDGAGAVVQVAAEILPLESPLPAALMQGAAQSSTPFDPSTAVAGAPLTAARGSQIEETLLALIRRPQVRFSWSALSDDFAEALQRLSPLSHLAVTPAFAFQLYGVADVGGDAGDVVRIETGGGQTAHPTDGISITNFSRFNVDDRDPKTILTGHADPLLMLLPTPREDAPDDAAIYRYHLRTGEPIT